MFLSIRYKLTKSGNAVDKAFDFNIALSIPVPLTLVDVSVAATSKDNLIQFIKRHSDTMTLTQPF